MKKIFRKRLNTNCLPMLEVPKNFGSLDDINEFLNAAKNNHSVNQAVGRWMN